MSVSSVQRRAKQQATILPGIAYFHRSSSLTPPGFLFVFVTLFLALGAINGQNNLLFWLFGFSIAALVISGIITGSALMGIRIAAHPIDQTEVGQDLAVRYTLHNTSRLLPNFALEVIELTSCPLQQTSPGIALHIRPNSHATVQALITPTRRGLCTLSTIRVRSRFPFGLFTKFIDFQIPRQAIVLPRPLLVGHSDIERLIPSDDSNFRSLNRRGSGLDYFAIREYHPGDSLRSIAWKQSARSSNLLVTEYPEPATEKLLLELALPDQQIDDELFELGVSLAYSILKLAGNHSSIGLAIPWAGIAIAPTQGLAHTNRCARILAQLDRLPDCLLACSKPSNRHSPLTIGYSRSDNHGNADLFAEDFTDRTNK